MLFPSSRTWLLAVAAALAGCAPPYARSLSRGDAALHAGGYERALSLYETAARQAATAGPAAAQAQAQALGAQGAAALLLGRAARAETAYRAALKALEGGPALARARMLSALGSACALQGRPDDAASNYRKAVEEYSRAPEAPAAEVSGRWSDLGQLELARRSFGPAAQAYERALTLRERAGTDAGLAPLLEDFAAALDGAGRREDAEQARRRARALRGDR